MLLEEELAVLLAVLVLILPEHQLVLGWLPLGTHGDGTPDKISVEAWILEYYFISFIYGTLLNIKVVLRIRIRIHLFLGLLDPDPDPLVRGMDHITRTSVTTRTSVNFWFFTFCTITSRCVTILMMLKWLKILKKNVNWNIYSYFNITLFIYFNNYLNLWPKYGSPKILKIRVTEVRYIWLNSVF